MQKACPSQEFRQKISDYILNWETTPGTRESYLKAAEELSQWRIARNCSGLWDTPPLMLTATLDDGWGYGLEVIEKLAAAAGVQIHSLGLLQHSETIVDACRNLNPDLLGLTVLQFDSDDDVANIVKRLPKRTRVVAGGAAFLHDADFARRTGTHIVIKDGSVFLDFLIHFDNVQGE